MPRNDICFSHTISSLLPPSLSPSLPPSLPQAFAWTNDKHNGDERPPHGEDLGRGEGLAYQGVGVW